jgi:tungstate transport system ATP-binding protein
MGLNLTLSDVVKTYNGKNALDHCSVSFEQGVVHVLMGPNGSGKSTLLRVCALLEPLNDGKLLYCEGAAVMAPDLSLKRRICLVLPKVGVFNTTVYKNVAYGLSMRGISKYVLNKKVLSALDMVGLNDKKNDNALTLSSGETQRLGIARAMAIEPEILFLDEPTASIDEENTALVEEIILALRKAGKTTIIMTTHDRDQALRLTDKVIMMRSGRIVDT